MEVLRLTPAEVEAVMEGFTEKEKLKWEKIVWATVNIMNASGNLSRPLEVGEVLEQIFEQDFEKSEEEIIRERQALKPILEAIFKNSKVN